MAADRPPEALPARLEEVLSSLPDPALSLRLRRVYAAAAQAIARLSDLDLVRYETENVDTTADLGLWEEMAPVIRDTVVDVNALLTVIREEFGQQRPVRADEAFARRAREATELLQGAMGRLAGDITQLGEAMRSPSVVSDRWNLLTEIQRFRSTFREQMGTLVYDSVSAFADVGREEVVPGYEQEVKAAVVVRAITSDLARLVTARLEKISEAEPEDLQWNAQQLQNELDTFGRTAAYRNLRAQDKRRVIEVRAEVARLAQEERPTREALTRVAVDLEAFVRGLAGVNQRQILIVHDREVWAACGVRLERAMGALQRDPGLAARALAEAAASAQALYGRDTALDTFLRKARRQSLAQLQGAELRQTLETFQTLLANLPVG